MHRRAFLASTAAVALGSTAVFMGRRPAAARNENAKFEITLTEEEWRERLTPEPAFGTTSKARLVRQ